MWYNMYSASRLSTLVTIVGLVVVTCDWSMRTSGGGLVLASTSSPSRAPSPFRGSALPDSGLQPANPNTDPSSRLALCIDSNPVSSLNCTFLKETNGTNLPFSPPKCANFIIYSTLQTYSNVSLALEFIESLKTTYTVIDVLFMPGFHEVRKVIRLENITNLNLCGFSEDGSAGSILTSRKENGGLIFASTNGVRLENLAFSDSGRNHSILQFEESISPSINNCLFRNNSATSLTIYKCHLVFISNSVFRDNIGMPNFIHNGTWHVATAGIAILMNGSASRENPSTFFISNVHFINNRAVGMVTNGRSASSAPSGDSPEICEQGGESEGCDVSKATDGGALRIKFMENSQNCVVQVINCSFVQNVASNGGGVFIEQQRYIHKSLVSFSQCTFSKNSAIGNGEPGLAGDCGALAILSMMTKYNQKFVDGSIDEFEDVNYVVISSVFSDNTARRNGGGLCFVRLCDFDWQSTGGPDSRSRFGGAWLVLQDVDFERNAAGSNGAGLYALGSILDGVEPSTVLLQNVSFMYNRVTGAEGVGALFAVKTTLLIQASGISMIGNSNSAMYLHSSIVVLRSSHNENNTKFINNTGTVGGAIFLVEPAQLVLDENTSLVFDGNHASDKGGAIYVQAEASGGSEDIQLANKHCFLKTNYERVPASLQISLYFENNWSANGGAATYFSSIAECICFQSSCFAPNTNITNVPTNPVFPFLTYIQFQNNTILHGSKGWDNSPSVAIATDPSGVEVGSKHLSQAPGATFPLHLLVTDQFTFSSWAVLKLIDVTPHQSPECELSFEPSQFQVNQLGANRSTANQSGVMVSFNAPNLLGNHGVKCSRQRVVNVQGLTDVDPFSDNFTLTIASCPPGFHYDESERKCLCRTAESRIVQCNYTNQTVVVQQGSWGEVLKSRNTLRLYPCPAHFLSTCHTDSSKALTGCPFPVNASDQCNSNRTAGSRLCGRCKPGYGLAFQAFTCIPCQETYVARLMWIIFAVVLVAYVIVRYNIRISPKIRGVLFALQNITFFLFELPSTRIYEAGLYISSITNLNFAFGLCVLEGLDALESTFAGYTAPLIVSLILIAAYVASSQGWMKSLSHESRLNGLLTLVFLAYQSLATTSLFLLYCQPVEVDTLDAASATSTNSSPHVAGDTFTHQNVFFFDGTIVCWEGRHLAFGIVAIMVLALLVLPLPILTFLVAIGKAPTRLRPFQDVLILGHGFRPKKAWWFSLDLVRRLLVSLLFIFITDYKLRVVFLELAALLLLTLHLFSQPYVELLPNIAEALVLLDLCIIGSLTIQQDERNTPTAIFLTLILLPVAYLLLYFSLGLWRYFKKWQKTQNKESELLADEDVTGRSAAAQPSLTLSLGYAGPTLRRLREHAYTGDSDSTVAYAEVRASAVVRQQEVDDHISGMRGHHGNAGHSVSSGSSGSVSRKARPQRSSLQRRKGKGFSDHSADASAAGDDFRSMTQSVDESGQRLSSRHVMGISGASSKDGSGKRELLHVQHQLKAPLLGRHNQPLPDANQDEY